MQLNGIKATTKIRNPTLHICFWVLLPWWLRLWWGWSRGPGSITTVIWGNSSVSVEGVLVVRFHSTQNALYVIKRPSRRWWTLPVRFYLLFYGNSSSLGLSIWFFHFHYRRITWILSFPRLLSWKLYYGFMFSVFFNESLLPALILLLFFSLSDLLQSLFK